MKFGDLSLSTELSYSMKSLPAKFALSPCTWPAMYVKNPSELDSMPTLEFLIVLQLSYLFFRKFSLLHVPTLNSIINEHVRVRFLEISAALLAHFQPARLLIS